MKLALVHDWIGNMGGAERVLKELTRIWPDAPVYTLFVDRGTVREYFPDTDIHTSHLARIPGIIHVYPILAPLMPSAMESFDLSGFDTVVSSSVMFAKGIIVRPDTRHISYCYSPSRMLWDRSAAYERRGILSQGFRHILRTWDSEAARRPDQMVAISQTVAARIAKYYRRDALVLAPPVRMPPDTSAAVPSSGEGYYLVVARLVPHKRLDMVVEAFNKLRYRLVIAGDGPLFVRLRRHARPNITLTGPVTDVQLDMLYANCRTVIVPNEEDFGLTAVEAMAHGKPVLALRAGGATETVIEGINGEFFDDPIPEALADGIKRIRSSPDRYDAAAIRAYAARWSPEHFANRMRAVVEAV